MFRKLFNLASLAALCGVMFAVGVSQAAIFQTAIDRLIANNTSVPVISACGTGTLATGSSDMAGEFTATGATGCTLTFGTAYASAPSCTVTEETVNTATRTTTVTATAIVVASGTSGSKYSYTCMAKAGG